MALESKCLSCKGPRNDAHYLCPICWSGLSAAAKRALYRRDQKASLRLRELYRQIHQGVPLAEIEVQP